MTTYSNVLNLSVTMLAPTPPADATMDLTDGKAYTIDYKLGWENVADGGTWTIAPLPTALTDQGDGTATGTATGLQTGVATVVTYTLSGAPYTQTVTTNVNAPMEGGGGGALQMMMNMKI